MLATQIIEELQGVVTRKFPTKVSECKLFLGQLDFEVFETPERIEANDYPEIRDPKDFPILASAIESEVDYFITGDQDFHAIDLSRPKVATLADFCREHLR